MKTHGLILGLLALPACLPLSVRAGLVVEMRLATKSQRPTEQSDVVFSVEKKQARLDITKPKAMSMIMSGQSIITLNPEDRTYTDMSEDKLQEMQQAQSKMMAQMAESMKDMPPQMRAMLEKKMAQAHQGEPDTPLDAGDDESAVLRAAGEKRRVGKWNCALYNYETDSGQLLKQLCVVPIKNFGLSQNDLKAMMTFGEDLLSRHPAMKRSRMSRSIQKFKAEYKRVIGLDKISVYSTEKHAGITTESTVKRIYKKALGPELFEVPEGYKLINPLSRART